MADYPAICLIIHTQIHKYKNVQLHKTNTQLHKYGLGSWLWQYSCSPIHKYLEIFQNRTFLSFNMLFFSVSKSFLDFRFYICQKNMTKICSVESDAGCPAICRPTNRDERERTILNVFAIYQSMLHCIAMRQNAKAIIHVFPFEYTSILLLLLLM